MGVEITTARAAPRVELEARQGCPSCGSRDRQIVWSGRFADEPVREWIDRHAYAGDPITELGDETFEMARCEPCGLLYHARVLTPEGLARLYGTWIDSTQIERFEAKVSGGRRDAMLFELGRQTVKHLLRMHRLTGSRWPFRLLDFGCGDGRVLRIAEAFGIEAHGIDPSATREARAEQGGSRVHPSLEALERAGHTTFDAVTMMEVLEHLASPRETLEAIARVLRPGGVLLVEVPDARGIDGPPRGFEEFRAVHPLEHVNAFTPETLEGICRRAGFRPVRRLPVHTTAALRDVLATELTRFVKPRSTSQYFQRV